MANIPILAARARGFFEREGLLPELTPTPSSLAQRAALMDGTSDIAHAAFDDVVAGVEDAGADFVAVLGGDGGFQHLYAQPGVASPAALRGRTVAVDDPVTAYALVLRAVLRRAGLPESGYEMRPVGSTAKRFEALRQDPSIAASMLAPPFSIMAEDLGWRSLGCAADLLGAYQGTVAFCRREWLAKNRERLARYFRAYLAGLRWALEPVNRQAVAAMIADALKVSSGIALRSCAKAIDEPGGLAPDCAIDAEVMRQVLALRAEISGHWGGKPPPYQRYVDLGVVNQILARSRGT